MIQVKHGRWFLMLSSPTSIYYKKMDASSSIEQPRANSLQMTRFLAGGYFTTGFFTTKFSLSFEAGLPLCLLLTSFLPLPSFFSFPLLFLVFLPKGSMQKKKKGGKKETYLFLGELGNKFKVLEP